MTSQTNASRVESSSHPREALPTLFDDPAKQSTMLGRVAPEATPLHVPLTRQFCPFTRSSPAFVAILSAARNGWDTMKVDARALSPLDLRLGVAPDLARQQSHRASV